MTPREQRLAQEHALLSPRACRADQSRGRERTE